MYEVISWENETIQSIILIKDRFCIYSEYVSFESSTMRHLVINVWISS